MGARLLRRHRSAFRSRRATSTSCPTTTKGRIKANYKGNYERLVEMKRKYDPENLFHVNQNIKP